MSNIYRFINTCHCSRFNFSFLVEDTVKQSKKNTPRAQKENQKPSIIGFDIAGAAIIWKWYGKNSIKPELINQILEGYKHEARPYVLNPKHTSPTSLPLYFYFGYQLLQESKQMQQSGHVSCLFYPI